MFQYAEVVYVGYGNKETVWAKDLLPSTGVAADQPADIVKDQPADIVKDQPANPQAEKPVETKPDQEKVQVETRPQAEALPVKLDPVPVKVDAAPVKVDAVSELGAKPVSDLASNGAQVTKWLKGKSTHSSVSDFHRWDAN